MIHRLAEKIRFHSSRLFLTLFLFSPSRPICPPPGPLHKRSQAQRLPEWPNLFASSSNRKSETQKKKDALHTAPLCTRSRSTGRSLPKKRLSVPCALQGKRHDTTGPAPAPTTPPARLFQPVIGRAQNLFKNPLRAGKSALRSRHLRHRQSQNTFNPNTYHHVQLRHRPHYWPQSTVP